MNNPNPKDRIEVIRWQRVSIAVLLLGLILAGVTLHQQQRRADKASIQMQIAQDVSAALWDSNIRLTNERAFSQESTRQLETRLQKYEARYGDIDPESSHAYMSVSVVGGLLAETQAITAARQFVLSEAIARTGTAKAFGGTANPLIFTGRDAAAGSFTNGSVQWEVWGDATMGGLPLRWRVIERPELVEIGLQ